VISPVRTLPALPRLAAPQQLPRAAPVAKVIPQATTMPPLRTYDELTATQKSLLGPDGRARFDGLSRKEKGVFLLHTARLARSGVDLTGLRLKPDGIQGSFTRVQLLFENDPAAVQRLKDQLQQKVGSKQFLNDKPSSVFHPGYDETGMRENIRKYPLQIGFGPEGVFVDMDRYNPLVGGRWNQIMHWVEILTPGNIDPEQAARALGENIWSSASVGREAMGARQPPFRPA
jgi:hypothetical protein